MVNNAAGNELFAKRLKRLREGKGLTQSQLAEVLCTTKQSIWNYEAHHREPNLYTLISIAKYFEVTTDYLLGLSDNKQFGINVLNEELSQISNYINNPLICEKDNATRIKQSIVDLLNTINKIVLRQLNSDGRILSLYKIMVESLLEFEKVLEHEFFKHDESSKTVIVLLEAEKTCKKALDDYIYEMQYAYAELGSRDLIRKESIGNIEGEEED